MLGDRIRLARSARGWTQDDVVSRLANSGTELTKAGLSKYERNKSRPNPTLLAKLAKVLGIKVAYFLKETEVDVEWIAFRKHSALPKKIQENIKAAALQVIENHIWIKSRVNPQEKSNFPRPKKIQSIEEVEELAQRLRTVWKLGESPIESITQTVEDQGGIVVNFPTGPGGFDGLSAWINRKSPVLITSANLPDDRRRFNLAHELGHLLMDCSDFDEKTEEKCAHRFAGAFLAPQKVVRRELGQRRKTVSFAEIGLLKKKYGMSMQAWIHRAHDLGVISDIYYKECFKEFGQRGWRKKEPVEYEGREVPTRLKQMVLRALSEGLITSEKADELCPGYADEIQSRKTQEKIFTASRLANLPGKERRKILKAAAVSAVEDYKNDKELTAFEAFDEDDFYDSTDERASLED